MYKKANEWIRKYVYTLQSDRNAYCIASHEWGTGAHKRLGFCIYNLCEGSTIKQYLYTKKDGSVGYEVKTMFY